MHNINTQYTKDHIEFLNYFELLLIFTINITDIYIKMLMHSEEIRSANFLILF